MVLIMGVTYQTVSQKDDVDCSVESDLQQGKRRCG